MANPPLPIIASNTEETAFAVLEGNVILEKVNIAITDMSKKMTTSIGHLTGSLISFAEAVREQQAAMLAKASLSADDTVSPVKSKGNKDNKDKNNFVDNVIENGLMKAAGMSIISSMAGIFTNMTTWMTGIVTTFTNIGKNIIKFGKLGGRLFVPITLIIGTIGAISASWESFAKGDIWGGLEKAVNGFFNSILTIPLDLIKEVFVWLLKKMSFNETADVLNSFSFTEEFNKSVSRIFNGIKQAFKIITDLFTFSEEDKTALGTLGKLNDIVFAPVNLIINYLRGAFGWSEEDAPPFKLNDWVVTKIDEAIVWVKGLFSWAGEGIAAGWTSLTDYVSQKWTDITTWIAGKLTWTTDTIGAGWTSLTDFVSQKWEDIKSWFGEKLTMAGDTIDSEVNFISKLVTDAWESVKQWFMDALSGIADSLPSMDDITSSLIASLPSWMVPDSYKTPDMIATEIKTKIADEQGRIDRSKAGSNEYYGYESTGQAESAKIIKELEAQLAEVNATKTRGGGTNVVSVSGGSSSVTNNQAGSTVVMGVPNPVGGLSPDRYSFRGR